MDCFLDVIEAASFLKVRVATLYDWVHQRRIPYRKHGRRLVFKTEDLDQWSESQAVLPLGQGYRHAQSTMFRDDDFDAMVAGDAHASPSGSLKTERIQSHRRVPTDTA